MSTDDDFSDFLRARARRLAPDDAPDVSVVVERARRVRRRRRVGGLLGGALVIALVGMIGTQIAVSTGRADVRVANLSPDAPASELARAFSTCNRAEMGELTYSPSWLLAEAEWLRITEVLEATRASPDDKTFTYPATVLVAEPGAARPVEREIEIHATFWPGIDWALANGGDAWLAFVQDLGYADDMVIFSMVTSPAGRVFFPGQCQEVAYGEPARVQFGARADEVLAALPYATREERYTTFDLTPEEPPADAPVLLHPGEVDQEVLDGLSSMSVRYTTTTEVDEHWVVCARLPEGWNDCFELTHAAEEGGVDLPQYVSDGPVELVLFDWDADLTRPLAILGTIRIPHADHTSAHVEIDTHRLGPALNPDGVEQMDRIRLVD